MIYFTNMSHPFSIKVYYSLDKSLIISKESIKIIRTAINPSFNKLNNYFNLDDQTGFLHYKLNKINQYIRTKVSNAEDAVKSLQNLLMAINSRITNNTVNIKRTDGMKIPVLFPDFLKIESTRLVSEGSNSYWESKFTIELETGLPYQKYKQATLRNNYVTIYYTENAILEIDYSCILITNHKEMPLLIDFDRLSQLNYELFYGNYFTDNTNIILPFCYDFNKTLPVVQLISTKLINSEYKLHNDIYSRKQSNIFTINSIVPKQPNRPGEVNITCNLEILLVTEGIFAIHNHDKIDINHIIYLYTNIYSEATKNAINNGNIIYLKEFSKSSPPVPLTELERNLINSGLFNDYFVVKFQFEFYITSELNWLEALSYSLVEKRTSNIVVVSEYNNFIAKKLSQLNSKSSYSDLQFIYTSIFQHIILKDTAKYYNGKINIGVFYKELTNNHLLTEFITKYQLTLSSDSGIEIFKLIELELYNASKFIEIMLLKGVEGYMAANDNYLPDSDPAYLALYVRPSNLIFVNPRYSSDKPNDKIFSSTLAHELFHYLSQLGHDKPPYHVYPGYTLLASPKKVRSCVSDMLNMITSNWNSQLIVFHD